MLELHPSWDLTRARKPVPDFARQAARGDAGEAPRGALAADAPDLAPDDSALRAHVPGVEMARAAGRRWDEEDARARDAP